MVRFTAGDLRRYSTPTEQIMWQALRSRRMLGLKFRRQHPIGPFIVDFVCLREKIVIEVDGPVHLANHAYDTRRDRWLRSKGYLVVRVINHDLEGALDATIENVRRQLLPHIGFG